MIHLSGRPLDHEYFFSYFSNETYAMDTQKNGLIETVLLSHQNVCLD